MLTGILMNILIVIGFVLLIVPGIYLSIAYVMAIPLVIDRNMGPWEALECSRKAVTKKWFNFFGILIVMSLIAAVSAIPLGIGLIWTIPMMALVYAIMYRQTFGVSRYLSYDVERFMCGQVSCGSTPQQEPHW